MDFKIEHDQSRKCILDYFENEDQDLKSELENLSLKIIVQVLLDRYNKTIINLRLHELAIQNRVNYEKVDLFLKASIDALNTLEEGTVLSDDFFEKLAESTNEYF